MKDTVQVAYEAPGLVIGGKTVAGTIQVSSSLLKTDDDLVKVAKEFVKRQHNVDRDNVKAVKLENESKS